MLFHVGAREDLFFEQVWLEFSAARKILCDETVGSSIIIRACWVRHGQRTLIVLLSDGRNLRLIVMIIAIMMVQIIVAIRQSIARL